MATTIKYLRPISRLECPHRFHRARRNPAFSLHQRPFSYTPQHRAEPGQNKTDNSSKKPPLTSRNVKRLAKDTGVSREAAAAGLAFVSKANNLPERIYDESGEMTFNPEQEMEDEIRAISPNIGREPPLINKGFFAMDEDEEEGPDPPFLADDISSTAHGELEQVRELRELYRVAGWDMPLLWGEFWIKLVQRITADIWPASQNRGRSSSHQWLLKSRFDSDIQHTWARRIRVRAKWCSTSHPQTCLISRSPSGTS